MANPKRLDLSLALLSFVMSFWLRASFVATNTFDGLYGQDPFAYYDAAQALHSGNLPEAFFWPLGYPGLLMVGFMVFGANAVTGQMINLLMGAVLTPLVYVLARQIGSGHFGALLAALLMTICGQAIQSSLVIMADIPALFWVMLSAVALGIYLDKKHLVWLTLSAVTLALACITRWLYLALIVPWALAYLLKRDFRWRDTLIAAATLIIFIPQLIYSAHNPAPVLNHAWVEGWSPLNGFKREFTNVDGHFVYAQENRYFYAQIFYDPFYLAPVFTPFMLIGFATLIRRKNYPAAAMLHLWALLPYLFLVGIPYQNIRFPLIAFPPIAVLAGVGFEAVARWLWRLQLSNSPWQIAFRRAFLVVSATAILAFGIRATLSIDLTNINSFIANQQRDRTAAEYATVNIPAGSTVYTFGLTLTLKHYTDFNVYELYYETPETLNNRWTHGQDDYLLLNVWNIENQWAGREPQTAYHWLRDQRGLTQLGRSGYYTLFRIHG